MCLDFSRVWEPSLQINSFLALWTGFIYLLMFLFVCFLRALVHLPFEMYIFYLPLCSNGQIQPGFYLISVISCKTHKSPFEVSGVALGLRSTENTRPKDGLRKLSWPESLGKSGPWAQIHYLWGIQRLLHDSFEFKGAYIAGSPVSLAPCFLQCLLGIWTLTYKFFVMLVLIEFHKLVMRWVDVNEDPKDPGRWEGSCLTGREVVMTRWPPW